MLLQLHCPEPCSIHLAALPTCEHHLGTGNVPAASSRHEHKQTDVSAMMSSCVPLPPKPPPHSLLGVEQVVVKGLLLPDDGLLLVCLGVGEARCLA